MKNEEKKWKKEKRNEHFFFLSFIFRLFFVSFDESMSIQMIHDWIYACVYIHLQSANNTIYNYQFFIFGWRKVFNCEAIEIRVHIESGGSLTLFDIQNDSSFNFMWLSLLTNWWPNSGLWEDRSNIKLWFLRMELLMGSVESFVIGPNKHVTTNLIHLATLFKWSSSSFILVNALCDILYFYHHHRSSVFG